MGPACGYSGQVTGVQSRLYYLRATAQCGWSRNVLLNQIKAKAYERSLAEGKTHNFPDVLPEYQLVARLPKEMKGKLPTAQQLSEALHLSPRKK